MSTLTFSCRFIPSIHFCVKRDLYVIQGAIYIHIWNSWDIDVFETFHGGSNFYTGSNEAMVDGWSDGLLMREFFVGI